MVVVEEVEGGWLLWRCEVGLAARNPADVVRLGLEKHVPSSAGNHVG